MGKPGWKAQGKFGNALDFLHKDCFLSFFLRLFVCAIKVFRESCWKRHKNEQIQWLHSQIGRKKCTQKSHDFVLLRLSISIIYVCHALKRKRSVLWSRYLLSVFRLLLNSVNYLHNKTKTDTDKLWSTQRSLVIKINTKVNGYLCLIIFIVDSLVKHSVIAVW